MRPPGHLADRTKALDEAAAQCVSCPTCGNPLAVDNRTNWNLRLVRAKECSDHGYFLVKYSPVKKTIKVEWVFYMYLDEMQWRRDYND